jgi:hypothetical protein
MKQTSADPLSDRVGRADFRSPSNSPRRSSSHYALPAYPRDRAAVRCAASSQCAASVGVPRIRSASLIFGVFGALCIVGLMAFVATFKCLAISQTPTCAAPSPPA